MTEQRKKRLFYNMLKGLALVIMLMVSVLGIQQSESLALEQKARCGLEEHVHTQECYMGDVLMCGKKMHTHSEQCYLVLLSENDINWLLEKVEQTASKSLEGVIDSTLVQALRLNERFINAAMPVSLSSADISALNTTIKESEIDPGVVLNENLSGNETVLYAASTSDGTSAEDDGNYDDEIALTDIGGTASTKKGNANFYIMLDGGLTFINSQTLTKGSEKYYCSYSSAVSAYTGAGLITGLSTNTINSSYFFKYTTSNVSSADNFQSSANYSNSQVRFGKDNKVYNALLVNRSGSAIEFYTVTLDYSQADASKANQVQYVEAGQGSTMTLSDVYLWVDSDNNVITSLPDTITTTTVVYAKPKNYTAMFVDQNGKAIAENDSGSPINGKLNVTLPDLRGTEYEGYYWIVQGSDGSAYYKSDGTETVDITRNTTFVAIPGKYTVTYMDADKKESSQQVDYRSTVTLGSLPEGYVWVSSDGSSYAAGAISNPITTDTTFTAAERTITVHYNVNFPTSATDSVDAVPTLYGTLSDTASDVVIGGNSTVARNLTTRIASKVISTSNGESQVYFFSGWKIEGTDVMISPDAVISWSLLETYANESGIVNLQGVWEEASNKTSATFFIRYDSVAVDINGNITGQETGKYTKQIFATYVGGIDTIPEGKQLSDYNIADTTADNSYTADQNIRALYGEKAEGIWLYDFPTDDEVFEFLKNDSNVTSGKLEVEGETVNPADLNSEHYAIRWYVFKTQDGSWHIDGKLVKKEGTITVDKSFGGEADALASAKNGFHIVAENGTKDADGVFTPYAVTSSSYKKYILVLNQETADSLAATYSNAEFKIIDSSNANSYEWLITGVTLGEYWRITEYPVGVNGYSYYAEYSVYDTDGEYTAIAEYGTQASVVGKAFALDEDPDQGLMVDFRNYYYDVESILIKKEDARTGQPIGGAVFELWQDGVRLTFNYNEKTGQYERDPEGDGTVTQIVTASDGFSIISTTGFSYEMGDVTVKEVTAPSGYATVPDITLGPDEDEDGDNDKDVILKKLVDGNGTELTKDQWSQYAEVPNNDVLVVKDQTSEYISVTVSKVWNTSTPADSAEVVLQANGSNAAALFPGLTNAQVKLNEENDWTYTWTDLPQYANGSQVEWGVKEVVIGKEATLSDGSSFANWTVTYMPAVESDTDGDGKNDNWSYTVINTSRRPQLILTKTGTDGSALAGATFTLEQVEWSSQIQDWQVVSGAVNDKQTTNSLGMLNFEQLIAGAYYRLSETAVPDGYTSMIEPLVITVNGEGLVQRVGADGTLTNLSTNYVTYTGPYNIRAVNLKISALPETGGTGVSGYRQSGLWLMLAAAALFIYRKRYRKEERNSS